MSRLQYVFSEALRNMGRNALVVLGAVLAVFISLFLVFGTLMFGQIASENAAQWSDDVRVEAFLSDELRNIDQLQNEIAQWSDVDEVIYISKPEAVENAKEIFADNQAVLDLIAEDPAFIPASLRIRPSDLQAYDGIATRLEATPGVLEVISAGAAVNQLIALRDGLQVFSWALAIALGAAAIALIANTIHMAVYARREEIEIMKLVGASNWYVRVPFLLEGMLEGLIGALVAVAVGLGAYRLGFDQIQGSSRLIDLTLSADFLLQRSILIVLFGVVVGAVGSAISLTVHRYIRT
ncbi:MAG: ABC transporter permease [Acidimicrobiia bacterium]|nr:ABC transporter permease [Acidimicrobiia bacterium]